MERAIKYELERMISLWEEGKQNEIVQETRGWDENKQATFSQRRKESSEDYRYFPDPDLPKMYLHGKFSAKGGPASGWDLKKMKAELPELPEAKRARYKKDFGIKDEDTEVFVNDASLAEWFEEVAKILKDKKKVQTASNFITSDFAGLQKTNLAVQPPSEGNFAELINLFSEDKISSRGAKDILAMIVIKDESPEKIAKEKNLLQTSDEGALKEIAQKIINANPKTVSDYKGGKENAIMSLVGQVMKETKGSANPQIVKSSILTILNDKN